MIASGVSVRHSVSPGWPFCPPGLLPECSRKLLTRNGQPGHTPGNVKLLLPSRQSRENSHCISRSPVVVHAPVPATHDCNNDRSRGTLLTSASPVVASRSAAFTLQSSVSGV